MIKKVLITLLIEVDTEDDLVTPNGDPLTENVVLNHIDNDVSLDDVFWECGYMYNDQIQNLKELDTPENREKYGDDFFDYEGVEIEPLQLDFELVWEGEN